MLRRNIFFTLLSLNKRVRKNLNLILFKPKNNITICIAEPTRLPIAKLYIPILSERKTIEAIKEVGFSEVQLNKYEDRPGTVSSTMKDKVPQEVIDRRYKLIKKYC